MASIRKRTWTAGDETRTAWIADYRDGEGKRRLKTFKTKRAADVWLVAARGEVARGIHTPDSSSATVARAIALWLDRGEVEGLEPQTLRTYRFTARHVIALLGHERLSRLTVPRVEEFRDELLRTRSRGIAGKALTLLKMALKDAQRRGLVAQNAARDVRIRVQRRHEERVTIPTHDEARAMLATASPRARPLVAAALMTGLRSSELRALAWADVDLERRVITVRRRADRWGRIGSPKSSASRRDVPLAPILINILREWRLACPPGELVFPNGSGRVENPSNIYNRILGPLQTACGITLDGRPKYSLHTLRHYCASWLIAEGFQVKRVQQIMGHTTVQLTLDLYTHLFPDDAGDQARLEAGKLRLV